MINGILISELRATIASENVDLNDDTELVIMYLKLGNILFSYLKPSNNKDSILSSVFKNLKKEFAEIHIHNQKSVKSLYQLAIDYRKLDLVKALLKQISIDNQILILRSANSSNQLISEIKNTVIESYYIDMYAKNCYYNQLTENAKDENWSFRETINLLSTFKFNIGLEHKT